MSDRVVVVGGGVIGLCCAHYAAGAGFRVTVLDAAAEGDTAGASHVNAGLAVPSHFVPLAAPGVVAAGLRWLWDRESPFYVRPRADLELLRWGWRFWRAATPAHVARSAPLLRDLHLESQRLFAELAATFDDDFGWTRAGLLVLCAGGRGLDEEARQAEHAERLGVAAEVLDAKQTATLEPAVAGGLAGSVLYPGDAHLDPGRLMAALGRALSAAGVEIVRGCRVSGFRAGDGRIAAVVTDRSELAADQVVLAAGAWSAELARRLGLHLPLEAGKGYSLHLPSSPIRMTHSALLSEARVAITPMGAGLRAAGTMELAGLDEGVDPRRVRGIRKAVTRYLPGVTPEALDTAEPRSGLRPCTPDGLPYLGRSAAVANLVVAAGHAMMGLSLGPVSGLLTAQVLAGETPRIDLSALAPGRWERPRRSRAL